MQQKKQHDVLYKRYERDLEAYKTQLKVAQEQQVLKEIKQFEKVELTVPES
jgi:hypothetical protein